MADSRLCDYFVVTGLGEEPKKLPAAQMASLQFEDDDEQELQDVRKGGDEMAFMTKRKAREIVQIGLVRGSPKHAPRAFSAVAAIFDEESGDTGVTEPASSSFVAAASAGEQPHVQQRDESTGRSGGGGVSASLAHSRRAEDSLYLCFRRRAPGEQRPALADVIVVEGTPIASDVATDQRTEHEAVAERTDAVLPPGYELLTQTTDGGDANLHSAARPVYLAFKRQQVGENDARLDEDPAITDICIMQLGRQWLRDRAAEVRDGDPGAGGSNGDGDGDGDGDTLTTMMLADPALNRRLPWGYSLVPKAVRVITGLPRTSSSSAVQLHLALRHSSPHGLCNVPLQPTVIDRFPAHDHDDCPLPDGPGGIPMFCFPRGLRLLHCGIHDAPLAQYFPYVLTEVTGTKLYVASVLFYEPISKSAFRKAARAITGRDDLPGIDAVGFDEDNDEEEDDFGEESDDEDDDDFLDADDRKLHVEATAIAGHERGTRSSIKRRAPTGRDRDSKILFAPKCLCLVSHHPFFRSFRRWLRQLYQLSLSELTVPLERCITHFVQHIPCPPAGGPALQLHLDDRMEPIVLASPDPRGLPPLDISFDSLFGSLSVPNIVSLLSYVILERTVVLCSHSATVVTEVCEVVRSFLFPLLWESCYVPRLTVHLMDVLEIPGAALLGVHDDTVIFEGGHIRSQTAAASARSLLSRVRCRLPPHALLVDLDQNRLYHPQEHLSNNNDNAYPPPAPPQLLPPASARCLRERLHRIATRAGLSVDTYDKVNADSAFHIPPPPAAVETPKLTSCGATGGHASASSSISLDTLPIGPRRQQQQPVGGSSGVEGARELDAAEVTSRDGALLSATDQSCAVCTGLQNVDTAVNVMQAREAALLFMTSILGDFSRFDRPPDSDSNAADSWFNKQAYIDYMVECADGGIPETATGHGDGLADSVDPDRLRAFYTEFANTQLFSFLMQRHTKGEDDGLDFYQDFAQAAHQVTELSQDSLKFAAVASSPTFATELQQFVSAGREPTSTSAPPAALQGRIVVLQQPGPSAGFLEAGVGEGGSERGHVFTYVNENGVLNWPKLDARHFLPSTSEV